ncbi:hypothetical protein [Pseudomonas khavaziana]|uniref:Type III effector n=1 Tax=Pseudomonas khavaziana TaxID=2842351 RepID=A0ABZ2DHV7_9PSED
MTTSTGSTGVFGLAPPMPYWNRSLLTGRFQEQVDQAHKRMEGINKPEQDVRRKPDFSTGRPPGDKRTAEEIIKDNPILANLKRVKDANFSLAFELVGDWTEDNKDPDARADAAFNAARVLNYIDTSLSAEGKYRGDVHGNGVLEGFTSSGDARRGTPAGMWKDFTEQGYTALRDDHRLDSTQDGHVLRDGSNFEGILRKLHLSAPPINRTYGKDPRAGS